MCTNARYPPVLKNVFAEAVGVEPTKPFTACHVSNVVVSANSPTLPNSIKSKNPGELTPGFLKLRFDKMKKYQIYNTPDVSFRRYKDELLYKDEVFIKATNVICFFLITKFIF